VTTVPPNTTSTVRGVIAWRSMVCHPGPGVMSGGNEHGIPTCWSMCVTLRLHPLFQRGQDRRGLNEATSITMARHGGRARAWVRGGRRGGRRVFLPPGRAGCAFPRNPLRVLALSPRCQRTRRIGLSQNFPGHAPGGLQETGGAPGAPPAFNRVVPTTGRTCRWRPRPCRWRNAGW